LTTIFVLSTEKLLVSGVLFWTVFHISATTANEKAPKPLKNFVDAGVSV